MSLVESWPSTEMRSKERFTHTPSSRSAVSGSSAASVWTKQSIVAKRGRDHPGALGLRGQAHGAARAARRRARRAWGTGRWCGSPRRRPRRRRRESSPRAASDALGDRVGRQRHADHAGRGDRDRARGSTPTAIAAAPCIFAASSIPRRPVAALALPELATTARSASSRQRSWVSSTGAASTPERVKRAALTVSGASETSRPRSVPPLGFSPQATPAARKPCGSPPSASATCAAADPARLRQRRSRQPLALVAPEHQVEVLDRLRRRALPQVVDRREHDHAARCGRRRAPRAGSSSCRAPRARRAARARARPSGSPA